jgi:aspartyl-tRNA(Asn)/glutamyl-tRNA(Gln) amidotransferase subunit A
MSDRSLLFASAVELGRLIQQRQISSVEATRLTLEVLEDEGRSLNAVAEITAHLALEEAAQADREIAAGRIRGPLHGVPYGAKDLLATRHIPTRWGSPAHRDQRFDYDATVIERLRHAGAVLAAKLAMIELAGGGGYEYAAASLDGPCHNPWNRARWAGGSSSGSGAAVGAGLVGFAIGTETWGSITVPAAFCNVSGLRPTYGRISRYGAMALCWTMDKIGPMARSAEDCGHILAAIAGHDARDASSLPGGFTFAPEERAGRGLRLGVLPRHHEVPATEARFAAALEVLRALGHRAEDVSLPSFPYDRAAGTIVAAEGSAAFEQLIRGPRLAELADVGQQMGLLAGLATPAVDYLRALRVRTLAAPAALAIFERCDALIAPTLLYGAWPIDRSLRDGRDDPGNGGFGNLLGWPSISIPMGLDDAQLPLGLEIIGPPGGEATLLALAMAFQGATDWHRLRPPAGGEAVRTAP